MLCYVWGQLRHLCALWYLQPLEPPLLWASLVPLSGGQGRTGLCPCPKGCCMAQPYSSRITGTVRSKKVNTYINGVILRPATSLSLAVCGGAEEPLELLSCLAWALSPKRLIPWGTLKQWDAGLGWVLHSTGEKKDEPSTQNDIEFKALCLPIFHPFWGALS